MVLHLAFESPEGAAAIATGRLAFEKEITAGKLEAARCWGLFRRHVDTPALLSGNQRCRRHLVGHDSW